MIGQVKNVVHQLDFYRLDHETLDALLEVSATAIRRLRTSPGEGARQDGEQLEEVYLDLKAAMARNCHRFELWGESMEPPAPRETSEQRPEEHLATVHALKASSSPST